MYRRNRRLHFAVALTVALVFALASRGEPAVGAESEPPAVESAERADPSVPPRRRRKLLRWLLDERYKERYVAEPAVHASAGPHGGNVRTYFNPILVEDLRAGRTTWSKGAAMVKELYFGGTDEVLGYAVMVKVARQSGQGGEGWLFYETFDTNGTGAYYGRGLRVCASCHEAGTDFLLSPFRPD